MLNYEKLYHKTFNAITDAHRLMEQARFILETAQQECEEAVICAEDNVALLPKEDQLG